MTASSRLISLLARIFSGTPSAISLRRSPSSVTVTIRFLSSSKLRFLVRSPLGFHLLEKRGQRSGIEVKPLSELFYRY